MLIVPAWLQPTKTQHVYKLHVSMFGAKSYFIVFHHSSSGIILDILILSPESLSSGHPAVQRKDEEHIGQVAPQCVGHGVQVPMKIERSFQMLRISNQKL